jgi:hypothetical protein
MSRLLISVRNLAEAELALTAGVRMLDLKEPSKGALGRVSEEEIAKVLDRAGVNVPVSAAFGEWNDVSEFPPIVSGLKFAKVGLSGAPEDWRERLVKFREKLSATPCGLVYVAYADWRRAGSPPLSEVAHQALHDRASALLMDTRGKDGSSLLDWLSAGEVCDWAERCAAAKVQLVLGGSLGPVEIRRLLGAKSAWFAVRGAACIWRDRSGALDQGRIRELLELLGDIKK